MAATAVPESDLVSEVEGGQGGVGRFLIVGEVVTAAAAGDAPRAIDAESPARQVEGVDAVVGHLATAVVAVPVPVVVDQVVLVGSYRCGTLPEGIVDFGRNIGRLALADCAALVVVPGAG